MKIIGLDTETTGLEPEKGHRIIEIAIGLWELNEDLTHRQIGSIWTQRIDPKRAIDPKAEAVHHISRKDLVGMPEWNDVATKVQSFLRVADVMVAHNLAFDAAFIVNELAQSGLEVPPIIPFCTMENGRGATPLGAAPSLQRLCWSMGVEYNESAAHAADYDVKVMMTSFFSGLKRGLFGVESLAGATQAA